MNFAAIIALAMVLDALLGEPDWLWSRIPHPAVIMGRFIGWLDKKFNTGKGRKFRGILVIVILVLIAGIIGQISASLPGGSILSILIAAILLAQRSLVSHVADVANALRMSLPEGRAAVARIVGRDTSNLDQTGVIRGAIESAAENLSDGVIAPVFWFLILGLPGLLIYKFINTADSMIGYKTTRHADFGWAAARLDDLVNWIPARLTAFLIAAAYFRPNIAKSIRRDAALHRSPNAGWPEAAMANCIDVSLAGPRAYNGEMKDFPLVHPEGRRILNPTDIDAAVQALWRTWWLALAAVTLLAVV